MPLYTLNDDAGNLKRAFYFIHIPKCAGTTIENLFEQIKFNTFLAPKDYRAIRQCLKIPPTHFDISLVENIFPLDKLYTFAIVRNPYDRLVSDYNWAITKPNNALFYQKMSFEEFCIHSFVEYSKDGNARDNHIRPQHHFISNNVNKVFKLEDGLDEEIGEVFEDIGVQITKKIVLNKLNASTRPVFEINQTTKDLIYDFYKEDFKTFGYEK
tara:strand:- start:778 stop:1413 length:636 start_codon:yes stop_codon:yes gene_type:complete